MEARLMQGQQKGNGGSSGCPLRRGVPRSPLGVTGGWRHRFSMFVVVFFLFFLCTGTCFVPGICFVFFLTPVSARVFFSRPASSAECVTSSFTVVLLQAVVIVTAMNTQYVDKGSPLGRA